MFATTTTNHNSWTSTPVYILATPPLSLKTCLRPKCLLSIREEFPWKRQSLKSVTKLCKGIQIATWILPRSVDKMWFYFASKGRWVVELTQWNSVPARLNLTGNLNCWFFFTVSKFGAGALLTTLKPGSFCSKTRTRSPPTHQGAHCQFIPGENCVNFVIF